MVSLFNKAQATPAEKELRPLIFDESCQVLSTFELNKIASLTFGDLVCDEIFELIEGVVAKPLEHSPLTTQKTLVMLKHILIYGSEKCVNSAYGISAFVESLQSFNTVLLAQQRQGARAMWQRLQGGGVDRGGPVREAAIEVHKLLSNINELRQIRVTSASKDSLVPIGDNKVAFLSDEVRHYLLKKKIEEQHRIQIKSNLAKSEGGFGGGYNAKDGKSVVGAAHGIEEMIKMANMEKKKWSDEGEDERKIQERKILEELKAEMDAAKAEEKRAAEEAAAARNAAILADMAAAKEVDLLDFSVDSGPTNSAQPPAMENLMDTHDFFNETPAAAPAPSNAMGDLLGFGLSDVPTNSLALVPVYAPTSSAPPDIFGYSQAPATSLSGSNYADPLVDPFAPLAAPTQMAGQPPALPPSDPSLISPTQEQPRSLGNTEVAAVTSQMTALAICADNSAPKKSVMASNEDRFAALDALVTTSQTSKVTTLDMKNAENRILGYMGGSSSFPALEGGGISASSNFSLGLASPPASVPPPAAPMEMPPMPPSDNSLLHPQSDDLLKMQYPQNDNLLSMQYPQNDNLLSMQYPQNDNLLSMQYPQNDNLMTMQYPQNDDLMTMPMGLAAPVAESIMINPSSVQVAQKYGGNSGGGGDDDDDPWVMGGVAGSGLEPVAPAPGAPPPPPPP